MAHLEPSNHIETDPLFTSYFFSVTSSYPMRVGKNVLSSGRKPCKPRACPQKGRSFPQPIPPYYFHVSDLNFVDGVVFTQGIYFRNTRMPAFLWDPHVFTTLLYAIALHFYAPSFIGLLKCARDLASFLRVRLGTVGFNYRCKRLGTISGVPSPSTIFIFIVDAIISI